MAFEQNSVSAACWRWQDPAKAPKTEPVHRRAAVQAVVAAVVAGLFAFVFKAPAVATVVCAVALFLLLAGFFAPPVFRAVDRAFQAFGVVVGTALTWLLLVPFFYLFFIPARLILAARGIDPMKRRFPGSEATFWTPHRPRAGHDDYRKQF